MTKGLVYYTDNRGDATLLQTVRDQLQRSAPGAFIAYVSLGTLPHWSQPGDGAGFAWPLERGYLTMFRQQLAALELLNTDVAFMTEHDVLYHPSHFAFTPPRADTFYYNQHTWRVDAETGLALFYYCNQVSGLCANRQLLVDHYRKRVAHVEAQGFDRNLGFEPGTNGRSRALDDHPVATWMSAQPNVDLKTRYSLTPGRWRPDQFRNPNSCRGWTESDRVPGWGITQGRVAAFLAELR